MIVMANTIEVPFLDLKAQYPQIRGEIESKLNDIISDAAFILGKHVEEFEHKFAEAHGVKYCVGVSSGTDALHVALQVLGIGRGDDVIVPVNTFIATAEAVSLVGARPVFVDCEEFYNIDTEHVRRVLSEHGRRNSTHNIKAIIPVHLYGQPADMSELANLASEFDVHIIEDAAQAHLARWDGKRVGSFGALAAFSFYPGKNLGAFGEAGAVITNDESLYLQAKMYRQHGEAQRYHHSIIGHNYRMEAIQGAVLGTKLKYLESWTKRRQEHARLYDRLLAGANGIVVPRVREGAESVYHLYVIQADDRDGLRQYLGDNGIATGLHYPIPLHRQPAYSDICPEENFPVADAAADRILSLPMFPELTREQIVNVCDTIGRYLR